MTDLENAARKYAVNIFRSVTPEITDSDAGHIAEDAFLTGAKSRDAEISRLRSERADLRYQLAVCFRLVREFGSDAGYSVQKIRQELLKLRGWNRG